MAFTSYGFQGVPVTNDEIVSDIQISDELHNHQITFEDLGIPRIVAVRSTIIGNVRTQQNLNTLDWVLLIGGLLAVFISLGLSIDRLILLQAKSPDYMFAFLLIFNAVFSTIYIFNAVFKEQAFEALAYALTSIVVIVYVFINFVNEKEDSAHYIFKLVQLILTLVLGGTMGLIAVIVAIQQMRSENLIFRTVGADSTSQSMCRTLFTTITLILFNVQILGSFLILSIEHGVAAFSLQEILGISIGFPWVFVWALLAYFAVRFESRYFFSITITLSPGHFAYVIYSTVVTALKKNSTVAVYCKYAAGGLGLLIHAILLLYLFFCHRNFHRGLKEKVFPPRRSQISTIDQ